MKHLPVPATAEEDDAVITDLCTDPIWSAHETDWLATYKAYRNHAGDPWKLKPFNFGDGVADRQYKLYSSRASSGPFNEIRHKKGLKSCPLCGSPTIGSLDHYLPRRTFPELAIMRANLLPACAHCNSGVKRKTYKGNRSPKRFIHPYFDSWANDAIWHVEFQRPLEAATFRAKASPSLSTARAELVQFHLDHVLGRAFYRAMENSWGDLPSTIQKRSKNSPPKSMAELIQTELEICDESNGSNGWPTAFYRGLALDGAAMDFIWDQISTPADSKARELV